MSIYKKYLNCLIQYSDQRFTLNGCKLLRANNTNNIKRNRVGVYVKEFLVRLLNLQYQREWSG